MFRQPTSHAAKARSAPNHAGRLRATSNTGRGANHISGQRDRNDATLPKGAIALNHANVRVLQGNELADNYIGISDIGSHATVEQNHIAVPAGGVRARIVP